MERIISWRSSRGPRTFWADPSPVGDVHVHAICSEASLCETVAKGMVLDIPVVGGLSIMISADAHPGSHVGTANVRGFKA